MSTLRLDIPEALTVKVALRDYADRNADAALKLKRGGWESASMCMADAYQALAVADRTELIGE